MDRFIEELLNHSKSQSQYLKSNMDRFIVTYHLFSVQQYRNLKSNMDRFIGLTTLVPVGLTIIFKIQYG